MDAVIQFGHYYCYESIETGLKRSIQSRPTSYGDAVEDVGWKRIKNARVAALPVPRVEASRDAGVPLILKHEIVNLPSITRLPFSRREANAILESAPPNETYVALDFEANRANATSPDLLKYRIVHFATHGWLDSDHPELSGVVLSLVNKEGRAEDGVLRLHEIYNLQLGADLVVLSACRTALGKEVGGEGLIGVTRGFMYAGAPRVIRK